MRLLGINICIALALAVSSCSKVDDACLTAPKHLFFDIKNNLSTCSDSDDYVLWEFDGGDAKLGKRLEHKFVKPGRQIVRQTVYSDDARKSSTVDFVVTAGFLRVDSIVMSHINTFGIVFENLPDLYLSIEGMQSDQIFEDVLDSQVPRTYTFQQSGGIVTGNTVDLKIYDYNADRDDFLVFEQISSLDLTTFDNPIIEETVTDKFRYRIYWSFVASK